MIGSASISAAANSAQSPILAAGAVCWRLVGGVAKVLVVHRDSRADVSLPKGKVDPGEMLPQTAVREIAEETGLAITLGAPLGTVEYTLPGGREKIEATGVPVIALVSAAELGLS